MATHKAAIAAKAGLLLPLLLLIVFATPPAVLVIAAAKDDPYSGMSIKSFDVDSFERKELPLYRRMAAQQPDQYGVNAELGLKLLATIFRRPRAGMHSDEALAAFNRAYRSEPNHPSAAVLLNNMGLLLKAMGRPEEAVDAHTRAVAQNRAALDGASSQRLEAEALYARSQARAMLGRHADAVLDLHAAIEAYPAHVAALREIAKQRDERRLPMPRQHYVDLAEALLASASESDRAELHMALFGAYHAMGSDPQRAWNHLAKHNRHHRNEFARRGQPYRRAAAEHQVAQVEAIFTDTFWPVPSVGDPTTAPIFVVGIPRSGSTLLESILSTHTQVVGRGEDSVFNAGLAEFRDNVVRAMARGDAAETARYIRSFGAATVRRMLAEPGPAAAAAAAAAGASPPGTVGGVAARFAIDKMLTNYMNVGFINLVFPNAPIVHIRRDPRDGLFSCYRHVMNGGDWAWTFDLLDAAHYYTAVYQRMMRHWDNVLPGRILHVDYERLVSDPQGQLRRVLAHIGVAWEGGLLDFHKTIRPVQTSSMEQVQQPLNKKAIGAWKRYAEQLSPLLSALASSGAGLPPTAKGHHEEL